MPGRDIGIDLGTATVLVNIRGKGIVLREPSVVAVDSKTDEILAIGEDARKMLGRTPGNITTIRPMRDGVISNYDVTQQMLKYFIKKVSSFSLFKPRIMVCVPSRITKVEERAVVDAVKHAGASRVYLIEEPVAAAIGAGIDITKPCGSMVVDIGGGTTDIAVLSLKDVAVSASIKVAGDRFDEAIAKYIRRKYRVVIGEMMAEAIKIKIGCVYPRDEMLSMPVKGRNLINGMPKMFTITSEETREALSEVSESVYTAVHSVLERTPPELVSDIYTNGIMFTGGGSLVYGLDRLIAEKTGVNCMIADEAELCVAKGTEKALENLNVLKDGLLYVSRTGEGGKAG